MLKYLVAFALLTPLIGILMVEGGEFAASIGVDGEPNGAGVAFASYASVLALVARLSSGRAQPPIVVEGTRRATDRQVWRFGVNLLFIDLLFLGVLLFGFGAFRVWLGSVGKGEFRAGLGTFGAVPNLMTKFIVPALLAYLTALYQRSSRQGRARTIWVINASIGFFIGASWGFKSTAFMMLVPSILILYWHVKPAALLKLGGAFFLTILGFSLVFDAGVEVDTAELGAFLLRRITVLQGDVVWHVWGMYERGEDFPNYWPTLLAAGGDKLLSLAGVARTDNLEWMQYHYDWMITWLAGADLAQIEEGHSITATPFAEGLVAGGIFGVALFAVVGGLLVGRTHAFLGRAITRGRPLACALGSTYFCFYIFPWLNGGAIVQLFHVSLAIAFSGALLAIAILTRLRLSPRRPRNAPAVFTALRQSDTPSA